MSGGYDPDYFRALYDVEDRHFWFGARNRALTAVLRQVTRPLAPGYRVLEVGCGTGYTLRMLEQVCTGGTVIGMDLFMEGLRFARQRTGVPLVQGRMEHPPFSARFHVVGLFDVLEHLQDDRDVLRQIRRLLEPHGCFVVTVPAGRKLWSQFDEESHHCRRYEIDELREKLMSAGFAVDYLTPFMASVYPLARVGRFVSDIVRRRRREAGREPGSAVLAEIKVRPGFNGALGALLNREASLIARRWTLPFGTSLLALARPLG